MSTPGTRRSFTPAARTSTPAHRSPTPGALTPTGRRLSLSSLTSKLSPPKRRAPPPRAPPAPAANSGLMVLTGPIDYAQMLSEQRAADAKAKQSAQQYEAMLACTFRIQEAVLQHLTV